MTAKDVTIVSKFLREQYGRTLDHIDSCRNLAEEFIAAVAEDARLGDAPAVDDDWVPSLDDVDEFAVCGGGMTRLWRQQEIAHYALIGLARAGRLLPRIEGERSHGD